MRHFVPVVLLASAICLGQAPSLPSEQQYLRFILLDIASLDHDPNEIKAFESHLAKQFGLNAQESASIHAAGQALKPLLDQNRTAGRTIVAGKRVSLRVMLPDWGSWIRSGSRRSPLWQARSSVVSGL